MTIFISYARHDRKLVEGLHRDLTDARLGVWYDRDLEGGQQWWDEILEQIRTTELFVFALSTHSVRSRACLAELRYAEELDRPILPVMVGDVNVELAPAVIGRTQLADYRTQTKATVIPLLSAVNDRKEQRPLPEVLPTPPATPTTGLGPVRDKLAEQHIDFEEQKRLVAQLQQQAGSVDQHPTLLALAAEFLARDDLTVSSKTALEALVTSIPVAGISDWEDVRAAFQPRTLSEFDPASVDLLRSLRSDVRAGSLTPVMGFGMTDSLFGSLQRMASSWARTFDAPRAMQRRDDLAVAAQFVAVMTSPSTLRLELVDYLRGRLVDLHADVIGDSTNDDIDDLLRKVWEVRREAPNRDPHMVLAQLDCPIYITVHPSGLLEAALWEVGKEPVKDLCRWKPEADDWPTSLFETEPGYVPSSSRPLVYHVFGALETPDSLVLSRDDYLDFLVNVTAEPDLVPSVVRAALVDSALVLLGFSLEATDVRVLLRALVNQEGGHRLSRHRHVGAQLEPGAGADASDRARRYLERYFGQGEPAIDIFWGSVEEFALGLAEVLELAS